MHSGGCRERVNGCRIVFSNNLGFLGFFYKPKHLKSPNFRFQVFKQPENLTTAVIIQLLPFSVMNWVMCLMLISVCYTLQSALGYKTMWQVCEMFFIFICVVIFCPIFVRLNLKKLKLESVQLRRHCNSKATPTSRQSIWYIISIFCFFLFENIAFWEVPPGKYKYRIAELMLTKCVAPRDLHSRGVAPCAQQCRSRAPHPLSTLNK